MTDNNPLLAGLGDKPKKPAVIKKVKKKTSEKSTPKKKSVPKPKNNDQVKTLTEMVINLQKQLADHLTTQPNINKEILLKNWEQIKTYFRKGNRPSQIKAIENFESFLKML